MKQCVRCDITSETRPYETWWKCCPKHTPEHTVDVVCTHCARITHPDQTFEESFPVAGSFAGLIKSNTESDPVNQPSHYTAYKGLEIIDLTEQMNFNRGNAVKYICRAGLKSDSIDHEIQDLEKAAWYIQREIERVKGSIDEQLS